MKENTKKTNKSQVLKISKTDMASMIKNPESGIMVVTFTKKDNTTRVMTCRQHPTEDVNAKVPDLSKKPKNELGYHPVWDIKKNEWRTINLQTVTNLETGAGSYKID